MRSFVYSILYILAFVIWFLMLWFLMPVPNYKIKYSETSTIYIKEMQTCLELAKALNKECED